MKYTEEHEWLRVEDDLVVVGITGHASEQLGDIVFVELPEEGATVTKDDEVVVIESVKAASDILAPLDGEIVEVNGALTDNPSLIKHALGVEAAMRASARAAGEDEEVWGIIGLVHDFDYQQNPTEEAHLHVGTQILRDRGWPEDWILAIASHADYMGVPRDTAVAKTLFAVDELSGFLTACALVRPDKSIAEVKVKSVKKKLKDKAFARGVNRDDVRNGAEELGVDLGDHIEFVRDAMATIADQLELPPAG